MTGAARTVAAPCLRWRERQTGPNTRSHDNGRGVTKLRLQRVASILYHLIQIIEKLFQRR